MSIQEETTYDEMNQDDNRTAFEQEFGLAKKCKPELWQMDDRFVFVAVYDREAAWEDDLFPFTYSGLLDEDSHPTGVTNYFEDHVMFCSDGYNHRIQEDYVDFVEARLGWNPRSPKNADRVYLRENKDYPVLFEGDGVDYMAAPRIPPSRVGR